MGSAFVTSDDGYYPQQEIFVINCMENNTLFHSQTWVRKVAPVVGNSTSFAVAFTSQRDDGAPYSITIVPDQFGLNHDRGYQITDLFASARVFETIYSNRNLTVRINPSGSLF